MKRLAALVVALALVAAALWLRSRLDDDTGSSAPTPPATYRLRCVTELSEVCRSLEGEEGITVELASAGATAAELAAGEVPFDGWLTPQVWSDLVAATDADALESEPSFVASSPLVLAARPERLAGLQAACAPLTWRCVSEQAGLKIGADRPVDGAWGLAVLGQRAVGWFPPGSPVDVRDGQLRNWLGALKRSAQVEGSPGFPATSLLVQPGFFDVIGTVGAVLPPGIGQLAVEPAASVALVLATPAGKPPAGPDRLGLMRQALVAGGWTTEPPAAESLPAGGTLVALRDLWERV